MERFLQRHRSRIQGVLSGFDRLLFRGTLRSISYREGLEIFLSTQRVLIKDFSRFAQHISNRLKDHAEQFAREHGRPLVYLSSPRVSKEDWARAIQNRDAIREGLVCVFTCVEPCQSVEVHRNPDSKHLELRPRERKCLHIYYYFADREFGLMHVRLQTWLPMSIQVCVNGREYLARQMDREGIGYEQRDNCFVAIDDLPRAQELLDRLTTKRWQGMLGRLAERVNPWVRPEMGLDLHGYYWSVRQGEYATDVMFRDKQALQEIYPELVRHATQHFSCRDCLRFLGRRTNCRFNGEVKTHLAEREEGVRIKHWVEENSIKMYDKQAVVLRIETTINNPRRFKVRRMTTRKGVRRLGWLPLRRGIADMVRRVEISRAANERYLEALAVVGQSAPTHEILDPVQRRITRQGRPYRALRPLTLEEIKVFTALQQGEHHLQGFRNADVRRFVYPADDRSPHRRRRAAGRVTRWLRLLRAHRLIRKVPHTHYYRITPTGQLLMSAAKNLRETDLAALAS
jgi:hypothetical protein